MKSAAGDNASVEFFLFICKLFAYLFRSAYIESIPSSFYFLHTINYDKGFRINVKDLFLHVV